MIGITGHRGVLGSLTVDELTKLQLQFSFYPNDIRDTAMFYSWLVSNDITTIINYAAIVPINTVNKNILNAYDVNVGGIIQMLKAVEKLKREIYFFQASSSHVYKSKKCPIKETDLVEPINTYGQIKLLAEKILIDYSKQNKFFKLGIGRIFSFYHERQKPPFLYPTILNRLHDEDLSLPFFLRGAESVRDFLNAEDVVNYVYQLIKKEYQGIINIGSGYGTSIRDFVQSLSKTPLDIKSDSNDVFDMLISDNTLLKSVLQ